VDNDAFFAVDPLARLLIGRLRLTPVKFALLATVGAMGIAFLVAVVTGSLLPSGEERGLLQPAIT
jgi:hypothetical protein